MITMDIGAIQWDAKTATPPVLETLTAAGIRTGRVLVTAEAPAMNPLEGFHDRLSAALFQGGFWLGDSALDWEGGMRRADFLEFLGHLRAFRHIDGAGDRVIPHAVVVAAFDAWQKSRSLWPIADWERVQAFLNEVPGQVYDDAFLDWAQDVVENRGWWRSDDFHERWEVENFRKLVEKHRRLNAEREAVRLRRSKAQYALSSLKLRQRVFERDGHKCRACSSRENLTIDHVVAVIVGGTDEFENLQTLCRRCNSSKGRKEAAAWRREGRS